VFGTVIEDSNHHFCHYKIRTIMTKLIIWRCTIVFIFMILIKNLSAQKIAMTADHWQVPDKGVEFLQYKGVPAMKIVSDTVIPVLKNVDFANGTIEYDVESVEPPFTGIFFRRQSAEECEIVYLRVGRAGAPLAMDAIQYCPVIKRVVLWDLLPDYQGPAPIKKSDWNHVKLVVSGMQMLVYVNDMSRPVLQIPRLEGNTKSGGIAFSGKSIFANLVIKPNETNGLSPVEGFDPTYQDPRYLRDWFVDTPITFLFGRELNVPDLPGKDHVWNKLSAERRGLVNLTRLFGISKDRRLVFLKTNIKSDKEQIRKINLGFSDEVSVILNGQLAYVDKNWYRNPIMKEPEGRCSIENSSFSIPLKAGDNELIIAVSNFFFGWGIVARLDQTDGISF